ncbi:hypothetical protein RJ639_031178 [Escallonia herrerae]|uniref:O-fucosyltransferase family protein n=1 Tax=Escallonia herrerae TaxID=1293975 RepID=A0AA88XCW7_9ASTE|nr:hypothetical protein RJ639_031178 [Escallonia herrerae]
MTSTTSMHGFSRLGNGSVNSPSPPGSPRLRHGRSKTTGTSRVAGGGVGEAKLQNFAERLVYLVISAVYRRRGVLLFAPLLYISAMLLYMGTLGLDVVSKDSGKLSAPPGSVYRSPLVFNKLWPLMEAENNRTSDLVMPSFPSVAFIDRVQSYLMSGIRGKFGSLVTTREHLKQVEYALKKTNAGIALEPNGIIERPKTNGFIIIEANGGLNQQRLSEKAMVSEKGIGCDLRLRGKGFGSEAVCDAVAVAGLLNATLVIPIFHLNSVWRDSSKFGDIFDEEFFIYALRNHVNVVKQLPEDILQSFDNNISNIVNLRLKGWSSPTYYLQKVLPKLLEMGAVRIAPFSNRLAHAVPSNIQGLRCLANFRALRFSETIRMLAAKMVDRMVMNSSSSGGKYISVHLRFEEDMVAFSCCIYDGGEEEQLEMDIARERSWRGKFRRRGRIIRPGAIRMDGKCPLTPLEVGMMLRGMGFDNRTSVYVAAGNIYKADKYMAPLKQIFPRLETKETLASSEELAPFKGHSSRLAALDYTVCLHSEVFVTTQGGNFPHFLIGHRRYLNEGHSKTVNPDKRKLALLFDSPNIRWDYLKRQLRDMLHHSDVKGSELKKSSGSLFTYPMPDCMCKQAPVKNEYSNTTN